MEQLQSLLKEYNSTHLEDFNGLTWALQFCCDPFPQYWYRIFSIAETFPKESRILEIGSGFGFVSSIFAYLMFSNFTGYEQDTEVASKGNSHLNELFGVSDFIKPEKFLNQKMNVDILVLVNCVYSECCKKKESYKQQLIKYYEQAGNPKYFILEVIDSSYNVNDEKFPEQVRLSKDDVVDMFPNKRIQSWQTYHYPENKRTKELYLIETV